MRPGLIQDIVQLTSEHFVLVLISMAIALAIGIPVGILLTRRAGFRGWVVGFANVMQTVPSLAHFGFLIPIPLHSGRSALRCRTPTTIRGIDRNSTRLNSSHTSISYAVFF